MTMNILGSTLTVFVIACVSSTTAMGLNQYAGYKEPCLVGGPEKYLKQSKHHKEAFWANVTERYNGVLCNSSEYLMCYNEITDDPNSAGICDCNHQHSRGYILVYDASTEVQQCRGYINSTCGRSMDCFTGLECEIRKGCQCPSSGCPTMPQPRKLPPNYNPSDGSNNKVDFIGIVVALVLTRTFCNAIVFI